MERNTYCMNETWDSEMETDEAALASVVYTYRVWYDSS